MFHEAPCIRASAPATVGYLTFSDQGMVGDADLTAARLLGAARLRVGQPFSAFALAPDRDVYYHQWMLRGMERCPRRSRDRGCYGSIGPRSSLVRCADSNSYCRFARRASGAGSST